MSFDKLTHAELLRTAEEDFAFELSEDERKSKKLTLAAFAEAQLKFKDYLTANPDQAAKYAPEESTPMDDEKITGERPVVNHEVAAGVVVAQPVVASAPWLIKMTRENPLYEVGKYRFTDTHPYVLVAAEDVDAVMANSGFRQATPNELSEYYG